MTTRSSLSLGAIALAAALTACTGWTPGAGATPGPSPSAGPRPPPPLELVLEWSYGPCSPDGRSCHQEVHAAPDGLVTTLEFPNPPAGGPATPPVRTQAHLGARDAQRLGELLASEEISAGMARGFACAQASWDATITLTLVLAGGGRQRQDITTCIVSRDPSLTASAPQSLVGLLEAYRYATGP